jgi:diguanylate cyclase
MDSGHRTFSIGERAVELMRTYCDSASPHSYEIWFTYVTGFRPQLNDAVKRLVERDGKLSESDVDTLYEAHVSSDRLPAQAARAGSDMLTEIDQVMEMIDVALGSTAQYGASLEAISADLADVDERKGLRDILATLVKATQDVAATNRSLETRLKDSRGEIDSLRETLETVRLESLIDPLTGIANRRHFESTLMSAVEEAGTSGEPLALIVIDIDEFKRFNDTYGHLTGDQVLRLVGAAMRENVDGSATLARFGGEEFGIILPRTTREKATACAETIRANVMGRELLKRSTGESLGRVTISLGVAMLRPTEPAASLIERADHCMYRAKRAGRNRTMTDLDEARSALDAAA